MRSNVSRTRRRKGASVYTPGSEECHRRKYATGSSYRPGSPIQRPWETVHRFRSSTLTFYFSRGGRLPAIVIWTRTPLNLTGQSAKETQIEEEGRGDWEHLHRWKEKDIVCEGRGIGKCIFDDLLKRNGGLGQKFIRFRTIHKLIYNHVKGGLFARWERQRNDIKGWRRIVREWLLFCL